MERSRFVSKRAALVASVVALPATLWLGHVTVESRAAAPVPSTTPSAPSGRVGHRHAPRASAHWPAPADVRAPFAPVDGHLGATVESTGIGADVAADGTVRIRAGAEVDVHMRLLRAGRAAAAAPPVLRTEVEAGRVVLDRGTIAEWYVQSETGLEQGFDLLERPPGQGSVVLSLGLDGARAVSSGTDAMLVDASGDALLAYRDLVVTDAEGRALPASLRADGQAIALVFDDHDAAYPVRVDPFVSPAYSTLNALPADLLANLGCGHATAIFNGLAVVGCPNMAGPSAEVGAGAVLLFQMNTSGGNVAYTYLSKLYPLMSFAGAHFGRSVAYDGARLVVGAPDEPQGVNNVVAGHVYVFSANGSGNVFTQTADLGPGDPSPLLAFGASVAIDGTRVLVGAPGGAIGSVATGSGSAYLFDLATAAPHFVAEIGAPSGVADDAFGTSVAIESGKILVGAPGRDAGSVLNVGSVFVFGIGATPMPVFGAEVQNPTPNDGAGFGASVALDLPSAVVGCPRCNNARGTAVGSAMVFTFGSTGLVSKTTLVPPDGASGDFFGASVDIDGDIILVGAPGVAMLGTSTKIGAAYEYVDEGTAWLFGSKLRPGDALAGDAVGFSVGIDRSKNQVILGLPGDAIGNTPGGGSARVFGVPPFSFVYVNVSGGGSGSVGSVPDGIVCPTDCVEPFATGTGVGLTATPAAGSYLASVSGACTASPCSFVVNNDATADYVFELKKPNGEICDLAVECTSGKCIDGVCCNDACGNGQSDCQACSVSHGGTTDGTCTPLAPTLAAATVCHPSVGLCDPAETCQPSSTVCPVDLLHPQGHVCRPGQHVICDPSEFCSGAIAECPTDVVAVVSTTCDNGIACDGIERCNGSGACVAGSAPTCVDDGNPCTIDLCVDPVGCLSVAQPGCSVVDGGAVFADAGLSLDASVDGASEGGLGDANVVPPPPTFRGEGGCSCRVGGGTADRAAGLSTLAVGLLGLIVAKRRRRR